MGKNEIIKIQIGTQTYLNFMQNHSIWSYWWEKFICCFHVVTWIHVYWKVFFNSVTREKHRTVIKCLQLSQIFDVISCCNIMTWIITCTCFLIKWLCTSLHFQWGPDGFFFSFVPLKSTWLEMWLLDRESIMSAGEGNKYIPLTLSKKVLSSLIQFMKFM